MPPNRKAFGRPIGDYANIQDYIALSRIEVEQAKLLVYKTAWLLDQGSADARREISMIKVAVARCYSAIADRAVQIFGAAGVSDDTPISAAYTAARAMRIYDGPDEVHLRNCSGLSRMRSRVKAAITSAQINAHDPQSGTWFSDKMAIKDKGNTNARPQAAFPGLVLSPRSVAVIGASSTPTKIGGVPFAYFKRLGFKGPIYPVNPQQSEIQELKAYPSDRRSASR